MSQQPHMDLQAASERCGDVLDAIERTVIADHAMLETMLLAVLSRGHVLIEDVPGTGKTLTAQSLATALGLSFSRIQFTPDLLPADVTGTHVFNEQDRTFDFTHGPIFANVVLADEINRAPPKTQSALLEAMEERQVTTDGETRELPEPFFVIATQNPVEQEGTFGLPEAQIDRFAAKVHMGYPSYEGEEELLQRRLRRDHRAPETDSVLAADTVTQLQHVPEVIRVADDIVRYIIDICRATREDSRVSVGVSPRGTQRLLETARARAVLDNRAYVTPDHIKTIAPDILAHRLVLTADARVNGVENQTVITEILESTPVPTID